MNYTLLTTEWNGAKLEFEHFIHIQKNVKMKTLQSRYGDARIDVAKVPARPLNALLSLFEQIPTTMKLTPQKRELVQIEKAIESRAEQSLEPPKVVQMSTTNSTGGAVAQMPSHRTIVRRIQHKRVIAQIPNPLSSSVLNVPDDMKTTIRGEPFYAFDNGKEDPNRFIISTTQNLDELEFSA